MSGMELCYLQGSREVLFKTLMGEFQLEVLLRKPGWEAQLCLGRAELAAGEQGCFVYIVSPNLALCNIPKGPDNCIFRLCFSSNFFFGEGIGKRKNHFRVTWSENLFRTGAQELCIVL